jgi:hypothetical protein
MDVIYLSIFTNFSLYTYHTCIGDFIVRGHDHDHRRHDHRDRHVMDKEQNDFHNHYRHLKNRRNYRRRHRLKIKELNFLERQIRLTLFLHA